MSAKWLATLASVNLRTVVGLLEAVAFVVWMMVGIMLHRITAADMEAVIILAAFIGAHEGLNVTAFGVKRATYEMEAHTTPPREDIIPPKSPITAVQPPALAGTAPAVVTAPREAQEVRNTPPGNDPDPEASHRGL